MTTALAKPRTNFLSRFIKEAPLAKKVDIFLPQEQVNPSIFPEHLKEQIDTYNLIGAMALDKGIVEVDFPKTKEFMLGVEGLGNVIQFVPLVIKEVRTYFEEGNKMPVCFSINGRSPVNLDTPLLDGKEEKLCINCQMSKITRNVKMVGKKVKRDSYGNPEWQIKSAPCPDTIQIWALIFSDKLEGGARVGIFNLKNSNANLGLSIYSAYEKGSRKVYTAELEKGANDAYEYNVMSVVSIESLSEEEEHHLLHLASYLNGCNLDYYGAEARFDISQADNFNEVSDRFSGQGTYVPS